MTTAGKIGSWLNQFQFLPLFFKMLGKGDLFPPPAFVFLFLLSLSFSREHVMLLSDAIGILIYQEKSVFLMRVACQTAKGNK